MTPGHIDRPVVDRHLIALRQAMTALRRHPGVSSQQLRADSDLRWIIERGLQLCAQNALDIASHISSAAGLDPATYSSSIDCLMQANVLPSQFGERFRGIAGFRNVLVHGYLDVDLDLIADLLRESLDDFEEFAAHVERWLGESAEPESSEPRSSAVDAPPVLAIGVDGCPAGWFFVALEPSGSPLWGVVRQLGALVSQAREPARVFVDIPIGLPDGPEGRECDRIARGKLGIGRASSVFPAPARAVLDAVDYEDAKRRSRNATGRSLSKQAFAILCKCKEVDQLLRRDVKARRIVREFHPELCFWALAGCTPMKYNKRTPEGLRERVAVLKRLRPSADEEIDRMLNGFRRKEVARDDVVDAMVGALTASAPATALRTLPSLPPTDSVEHPMEMVYLEQVRTV